MKSLTFLREYRQSSFIAFCLIVYCILLFLSSIIPFAVDGILYEKKIDIRLIVMFVLAEPHFAMTLPLLYGYKKNFTDKPISYTFIPLIIIFFGTVLFFQSNILFLYIYLLANIFHVNRQSVGFFMLQGQLPYSIKNFYEISLHFFTILCLYFAMVLQFQSLILALLLILIASSIVLVFCKIKTHSFPSIKDFSIIIQGYLIFLPLVIFSDLLLAFAVGISIHYLQYLSISWRVCKLGFSHNMKIIFLLIIIYSILSTASLSGFFTLEKISIFILIPTMLQLLHFYYDSLIWRRKNGGDLVTRNLSTVI